jgi:hypothetical protein
VAHVFGKDHEAYAQLSSGLKKYSRIQTGFEEPPVTRYSEQKPNGSRANRLKMSHSQERNYPHKIFVTFPAGIVASVTSQPASVAAQPPDTTGTFTPLPLVL